MFLFVDIGSITGAFTIGVNMSSVEIIKQAFEKAFSEPDKIKPGDKVYLKGRPGKCHVVTEIFTHKIHKLDDEDWAILDDGQVFWPVFLLSKWG